VSLAAAAVVGDVEMHDAEMEQETHVLSQRKSVIVN
jgi:hypothetical protein